MRLSPGDHCCSEGIGVSANSRPSCGGSQAAIALFEYMRKDTAQERRDEIRDQMLTCCKLDTWAMVQLL